MKYFLYVILFFCSATITAQDYEEVDRIALSYTDTYSSPEKLAHQIAKDFKTDTERVRALYTWIGYYIDYDINENSFPIYSYSNEEERIINERKYAKRLSKRVITKRKAVCQGYSYLFKAVCDILNIHTTIVTGASKTLSRDIGKRYNSDHAWNIITINNKKYFIDVTWSSQRDDNKYVDYYYFMTPPELFILNHYPDNYNNSLLEKKVSKQEFLENPIFYNYTPSKIALIHPSKGILSKGKTYPFQFKIKQPIDWVLVQIGRTPIEIKDYTSHSGVLQFNVNIPKNSRARDMLLFINGEAIVSYAIK